MRVTVLWMAAVLVSLIAYGADAVREYGLGRYENGGYSAGGTENGQAGAFTLEELGAVIEASGRFWTEWWMMTGRFDHEHLGEWGEGPEHLLPVYAALLPSSGFGSLDDIRRYLLQLYTEQLVDSWLSSPFAPFREYDNTLFIHQIRVSSVISDWDAAVHTLVDLCCCGTVAVVDTTIVGIPSETPSQYFAMTPRFTLVNGRIDSESYNPVHYVV